MIPKHELDKAISVAMKYRIGKLYLIGSSLSKDIKAVKDYDFAVSGVPKGSFLNSMVSCSKRYQRMLIS